MLTASVALALAYPAPAAAAPASAHLSQPNVPASVYSATPFTVTGFVDKAAASGPIRLLFYQNIRGRWVLQKTAYARWSGWTSATTKYLMDLSLPYAGAWRVGAVYGGNARYASDYRYRDFAVTGRDAHLTPPEIQKFWITGPASSTITPYTKFDVLGEIDEGARGRVKILIYKLARSRWVLYRTGYSDYLNRWARSGYRFPDAYESGISLPYTGAWRIGVSYGGGDGYAPDYEYVDVNVASPYPKFLFGGADARVKPGDDLRLSVAVSDQGDGWLPGAAITSIWHLPSGTRRLTTVTDAHGQAQMSVNIGPSSLGQKVVVDVTASYGGHSASRSYTSYVR